MSGVEKRGKGRTVVLVVILNAVAVTVVVTVMRGVVFVMIGFVMLCKGEGDGAEDEEEDGNLRHGGERVTGSMD